MIPAINEEKSIGRVVLLTQKNADIVIVVDDGSTDLTGDIAEKLGAITLRHGSNRGKGAALRTGIDYAIKELQFDVLVTLDSDLQHDPNEIPKVTKPILENQADLVIGVRPMTTEIMPRERIVGNKILDRLSNVGDRERHQDTQSGFRAYNRVALTMIKFIEEGLAIESQTYIDAVAAGLRIIEIPISTTYSGIMPKRSQIYHFSQILDYFLRRTIV